MTLAARPRKLVTLTVVAAAGAGALVLALGRFPAELPLLLLGLVVTLVVGVMAFARPLWVVYAVTALIPFETFLSGMLPGPDRVALAAQFVSEAAIYGTLALVLARRALGPGTVKRSPLDVPLLVFVAVALSSLLISAGGGSSLFAGALNLRVLLRYAALFYLVLNLGLGPRQVRTVLGIILVTGSVNVAIGLLQWGVGEPFRSAFLPRNLDASIAGLNRNALLVSRGREIGAVFGATSDTLFFGLFTVIVTAVFLGRIRRLSFFSVLVAGLLLFATALSFARAAVLVWFVLALLFYRWRYGLARSLVLTFTGILGLATVLVLTTDPNAGFTNPRRSEQSIVENVTSIFSESYLRRARNQRLGHLIGTVPTILLNRPLLGYGPDQDAAIAGLNDSVPSLLLFEVRPEGFEDVYWMALLAYYGLPGLIAFAALLAAQLRASRRIYLNSREPLARGLAITVAGLAAATILLMFVYRVPEFRIYSYYWWLLPALLFALDARERAAGPEPAPRP